MRQPKNQNVNIDKMQANNDSLETTFDEVKILKSNGNVKFSLTLFHKPSETQ